MNQVEIAAAGRVPGVLVAADVGLYLALLQQGLNGSCLMQHFARAVSPLAETEEGQMADHQTQPGIPGLWTGQLLPGPSELLSRNTARAGIPHQPEHSVLGNAVVKGKSAAVDKLQAQSLPSGLPEPGCSEAVGGEPRGAVMVPNRR